jgi:hypothetical protein
MELQRPAGDKNRKDRFSFTGNQALSLHTIFIIAGAIAEGRDAFAMPRWYLWVYLAVLTVVTADKMVTKLKGGK